MRTVLEDLRALCEDRRLFAEDCWESFHEQALVACDIVAKLEPIIEKLERREREVYAALIAADEIFGTWYSAEYTNHKLAKPIRELLHGRKP